MDTHTACACARLTDEQTKVGGTVGGRIVTGLCAGQPNQRWTTN